MSASQSNSSAAVQLQNTLQNPATEFTFPSQNKTFPTTSFGAQEAQTFQQQFNEIVSPFPSEVQQTLFSDKAQSIAHAATFAKHQLNDKLFGGLNPADNEIGFDLLRPGHIRSNPADGTAQNTWYFNPSSQGWNDWIGNGAGNNYTVGEDQVVVVFGVMDQDVSTEVSTVDVQDFGRNVDMVPKDLNSLRVADNKNKIQIASFPSLIGQENDQVYVKLQNDRATESQPRLFGLTFGTGSYMNTENYS